MRNFDYSSLATRSWDNEIIGLVAQIHEYKGRQELWLEQKPTELERLIEIAKENGLDSYHYLTWALNETLKGTKKTILAG